MQVAWVGDTDAAETRASNPQTPKSKRTTSFMTPEVATQDEDSDEEGS